MSNQDAAKEELKKALPIIVELLNNPAFVGALSKTGFKANAEELLKVYDDTKADEDFGNMAHIGLLNDIYKGHIKAAYDISLRMKAAGYERPWIIVKETVTQGGPLPSTMFETEIEKRLRLEIR